MTIISLKRIFDFSSALTGLVLLFPVLVVVAVLVRWKLGGPVIFQQRRPGLQTRPFVMYKFRTMTDARNSIGEPLPDELRLTKFGLFLRSTSLDELPALWNVVKGDMSLVGPRPLAEAYVPLYSPKQLKRHDVRPGITGLAQVNGRNSISWAERFEFDVWYVENRSLTLDLRILARTVQKVIKRSDVHPEGQNKVVSFDGTN